MGNGTCEAGDCVVYVDPFDDCGAAKKDHGDVCISCPVSLTTFCRGRSRPITSIGSKAVTALASFTLMTRSV